MARSKQKRLPRRGYVLVSLAVVDENGFTHQYQPVETPVGAFRDGLATITLPATPAAESTSSERTA
jgi:hypothetical protein